MINSQQILANGYSEQSLVLFQIRQNQVPLFPSEICQLSTVELVPRHFPVRISDEYRSTGAQGEQVASWIRIFLFNELPIKRSPYPIDNYEPPATVRTT